MPGPLPGTPAIELCSKVSNLGEGAGAATVAHELTHTLGGQATYGSACRNHWYTIMSCTIGAPDERKVVHIDPFHKMKFGWLLPSLISTTSTPSCVNLKAIDHPTAPGSSLAYIIMTPVEYQRSSSSSSTAFQERATTTEIRGIPARSAFLTRAWRSGPVRIDPTTKRLLEIPSIDGGDGKDASMFLIPPSGTAGMPTMGNGLWLPEGRDREAQTGSRITTRRRS